MSEYDFKVIWSDNLSSNIWSTASISEAILSDAGTVQQVESSLPMGERVYCALFPPSDTSKVSPYRSNFQGMEQTR